MAFATDALMPAANTVTNTTTASPIMSAPAVTAVRPGLRTAFSRGSRPGRAPRRPRRPADERGQRPYQARAEHRDAEQRGHRATADQAGRRARVADRAEQTVGR